MLHHNMQQRQHVADLRAFQHCGVADDERGHTRLFQGLLVFVHGAFGPEQHGHGTTVLHHAVLHAGVAPQRLAAEPHDAIDLLPERLVADQSDGAPIGFGDIRQRGHIDLMQRCAARAARGRTQRQCQIVRGLQHDPGVAACGAQRIRLGAGRHMEVPFEHAEGAGTSATPGVDRLERVAHGADGTARPAIVGMEQRGQQHGLRGGGVLVLVQQHMAEPFAIPAADGWEPADQLIRRDREIPEFGHGAAAFLLVVFLDQIQQQFTLFCGSGDAVALIDAVGIQFGLILLQLDLPLFIAVLLGAFRQRAGEQLLGYRLIAQRGAHPTDESVVPTAYRGDGFGVPRAVRADHRAGYSVGQTSHVPGQLGDRRRVLPHRKFIQMPLHHIGSQLQCTGVAQRLRVPVEADQESVLADDGLEERIVGGDGRLQEHPVRVLIGTRLFGDRRRDAVQQLARSLAREGQAQDALGSHAVADQGDDAPGHGIGLA